ncbi:alpha/beta fold hydrolase [Cognatishimia sp. MH4019]|uniref:alpha/beta fold hydrolase n=1 Tax=Cognatishimia sp. MH4019 TaxID=2854030 RepID=UPI001CD2567D|nr:alpha/beta fold hydrolase [Cognatishimia sp. MH4019]
MTTATALPDDLPLEGIAVGEGPALVLLHGAGVDLDLWTPQMPAFAACYRVIALNLPGHGDSPMVSGGVPAMADAVMQTLDALGIQRAAFMGLSLGGMVALEIAGRWPDRATHLIMVEAVPFVAATSWGQRLMEAAILPLRLIPPRWLAKLPAKSMGAETEEAGRYVKIALAKMTAANTHRILRDALRYDGRPRLAQVTAPTLVMVGAANPATHSRAQVAADGIQNAQFEVVPNAGHILNRDAAAHFTARSLAFLETPTTVGGSASAC